MAHATRPEQVSDVASEGAAELIERLERRVLTGALQPVERRPADAESPRHLDLGEARLGPQVSKRLGERAREVHAHDSCAAACSYVNISGMGDDGASAGTITRASDYVSLAGEFFVLAELALRRLDGTLTLGHTKGIDILVLNRRTAKTFKVEVKTTEGGIRRSSLFKSHYSWLMHERHAEARERDLVYAFVLLSSSRARPRFFLVSAGHVAEQIRKTQELWEVGRTPAQRREAPASSVRQFRFPAEVEPRKWPAWPASAAWEENWAIFGPSPLDA
jgi:hypothetical protein